MVVALFYTIFFVLGFDGVHKFQTCHTFSFFYLWFQLFLFFAITILLVLRFLFSSFFLLFYSSSFNRRYFLSQKKVIKMEEDENFTEVCSHIHLSEKALDQTKYQLLDRWKKSSRPALVTRRHSNNMIRPVVRIGYLDIWTVFFLNKIISPTMEFPHCYLF